MVFGVIVGLVAEEFTQFGHGLPLGVFHNGAITGGARVAAGAAVAVGGKPLVCGAGGGGCGSIEKISVHRSLVYRARVGSGSNLWAGSLTNGERRRLSGC